MCIKTIDPTVVHAPGSGPHPARCEMRCAIISFVVPGIVSGECRADLRVRRRIHRAGGIVQDQHLWLLQQSPGNTQPLLLSAGYIRAALLDISIVTIRQLSR